MAENTRDELLELLKKCNPRTDKTSMKVIENKVSQLKRVSRVWTSALSECGCKIASRNEPYGPIVIDVTGLPRQSVNATVQQVTDEMTLIVYGRYDHARCVSNDQLLQAELVRHGMKLKHSSINSNFGKV
jgi:hypothetical protein